jgi:hypothetical protein
MRKSLPLVVLFATAALVPVACGKAPAVPSLTLDAGFAFDGGALATADGGDAAAPIGSAPASAAPSGSASAAPSGSASAAASASASASAAAAALAGPALDAAIDLAMAADAPKDAPAMAAEGQPGRATLAEGGHTSLIVTLQPGRCYTVIAMSAPLQVAELGVTLYALPLNMEAGRSAATDKNPAVLGKGKTPTCPISPIPMPYKVDVVAKKGAGRVSVQLFSKAK